MVHGVDHVAIRAKDPGSLMDWYKKTFGLKVTSTGFLKLPDGVMLEFLEAEEDGGILGDKVSGIRHIAFRVENFDAMVDLIQKEGLEIVAGPSIGSKNKAVFFRDPEGNILQFQYWIVSPD
jgi:catechol-2,3-dioxygenase